MEACRCVTMIGSKELMITDFGENVRKCDMIERKVRIKRRIKGMEKAQYIKYKMDMKIVVGGGEMGPG